MNVAFCVYRLMARGWFFGQVNLVASCSDLMSHKEQYIIAYMRIISRKTLLEFWNQHTDAEEPLRAWHIRGKKASWKTPADIKVDYANASIIANNRVVFNIRGNHYRLVVAIDYQYGIIYIRFVGTHKDYDKIDATTI
jgi:mRNA interferase HigB